MHALFPHVLREYYADDPVLDEMYHEYFHTIHLTMLNEQLPVNDKTVQKLRRQVPKLIKQIKEKFSYDAYLQTVVTYTYCIFSERLPPPRTVSPFFKEDMFNTVGIYITSLPPTTYG